MISVESGLIALPRLASQRDCKSRVGRGFSLEMMFADEQATNVYQIWLDIE